MLYIDKIIKKQMSKEKEYNIIQKKTQAWKKHMQLNDETNKHIIPNRPNKKDNEKWMIFYVIEFCGISWYGWLLGRRE